MDLVDHNSINSSAIYMLERLDPYNMTGENVYITYITKANSVAV